MSHDEQLQLKKDTLWQVHELNQSIACWRCKLTKHMEALKNIYDLWKDDRLSVYQGRLAESINVGGTKQIDAMPEPTVVAELEKEISARDKLKNDLDGIGVKF